MIYYKVVKQKLFTEELGKYVSYGIRIHTEGSCFVLQDVSTNKRELRRMVALCNKHRVDPRHLTEIIEDFLG